MNRITVGVLNSSKEVTEVLTEILEMEGFHVVSEYTYKYKNDENLFDRFIELHQLTAIVYDIAIPYEENYALFLKLSARSTSKDVPFVLTTTNKAALESMVGETTTHEIIGKPYDLKVIVDAVKHAVNKRLHLPPKPPV